jgi:hypothetical protein
LTGRQSPARSLFVVDFYSLHGSLVGYHSIMLGRVSNSIAFLSAMCCTAVAMIWIGSCFQRPAPSVSMFDGKLSTSVSRGRINLLWASWTPLSPGRWPDGRPQFYGSVYWPAVNVYGVYVPRVKDASHFQGAYGAVTFPCWILLLLTTTVPMSKVGLKRRKSIAPNHCKKCDYDLQATPLRCPECGTVP